MLDLKAMSTRFNCNGLLLFVNLNHIRSSALVSLDVSLDGDDFAAQIQETVRPPPEIDHLLNGQVPAEILLGYGDWLHRPSQEPNLAFELPRSTQSKSDLIWMK